MKTQEQARSRRRRERDCSIVFGRHVNGRPGAMRPVAGSFPRALILEQTELCQRGSETEQQNQSGSRHCFSHARKGLRTEKTCGEVPHSVEAAIWLAPHLICGKGAVGENSISPRDTQGRPV